MEELEKGRLRELTLCKYDTTEKRVKALAVVQMYLRTWCQALVIRY